MMDRICMTLGGRVSEEIFFGAGNVTTGAQDDLQKITRMAFEACANYGMNDIIGPVSYGGREGQKESWTKPFSEKTGEMLDAEVRKMILYVFGVQSSRDTNVSLPELPTSARQSFSLSIVTMLRKSQSDSWRRRSLCGQFNSCPLLC